jgi:pimeloyl-[acyl-carrier protein] methyl ester esterase
MRIDAFGSGPDLILIHGWAMHGGIFAPLAPLLAEHFRVHAVDLPGHGRSIDSDESIDPARCAAHLAARLPRAIWAGWSYGGLVSLHAALDFPRQVRGLVQIASSPRFVSAPDWPLGVPADVFMAFARDLLDDYRGTIVRFLALETLGSAQAQDELRELKAHVFERGDPVLEVLEHALDVLQQTDLRAALPRLSLPSLWIAGRRDRLVRPAAMRWAAQHSADGRFVEIASGHAPFLRHAGEVAAAIAEFAAGLPPS